jgi:adenylate kinase family enzyme
MIHTIHTAFTTARNLPISQSPAQLLSTTGILTAHSPLAVSRSTLRPPSTRIVIIGSSGAGKSTLARQLGHQLHLPVIHLDQYFWRPGWVPTPEKERAAIVTHLVGGEKWIIDGTYRKSLDIRLQAADTIIFLDLSRWVCAYRASKRRLLARVQKRQDIAQDCEESLLDARFPRFIRKILDYPERTRPSIVAKLHNLDQTKQIIWLQTKEDVRAFRADPLRLHPR